MFGNKCSSLGRKIAWLLRWECGACVFVCTQERVCMLVREKGTFLQESAIDGTANKEKARKTLILFVLVLIHQIYLLDLKPA